jgi:DNA-binding PadR family transcriptional regulator
MSNVPTPDETMLGILAARPQHGYQLLAHFNDADKLGRVWSISTSQVYAVLKRLEHQGLIQGHEVPMPDAPPRMEYSVTESGRERLQSWLYDPKPSSSIRRVRIEFISKIYAARLLGIPVQEIIRLQRQVCAQQREQMALQKEMAESVEEQLVMEFVIGQLEAAIAWIDSCEGKLTVEKR